MMYRKLDSSGDYVAGLGAYYTDNRDSVVQAIKTRLLLWLGEWFLDTPDGTDWGGRVLGERTTTLFEDELKRRILLTPNVVRITSFNYQIDTETRLLAVQTNVDIVASLIIASTLAQPPTESRVRVESAGAALITSMGIDLVCRI